MQRSRNMCEDRCGKSVRSMPESKKAKNGRSTPEGGKAKGGRSTPESKKAKNGRNTPEGGKTKGGRSTPESRKAKNGRSTPEGGKTKGKKSTPDSGKNTDRSRAAEKRRNTGRRRGDAGNAIQASVSQNFITSRRLIHRLIRISAIGSRDTVLEIGTGKGHLTQELCREAGYVYSVEIDRRLYEIAQRRLAECTNLSLIHGDFLQYKLPVKGDYSVFANIPYCITTQIMEKLINSANPPKDIWLVMEKGAAKRFLGVPDENPRSLRLKVYWSSEIRYYFQREDFHPMPSVDSVLVHFSLKAAPDLNREEYSGFCRFIDEAAKRGVCGKKGLLTNRQAAAALKLAGLPHAHEDGVTLYIQWLCLFRCWQEQRR